MAHLSLFPLAASAPRVRIAFLVTVGLLLALLFSGAGRAEADSHTSLFDGRPEAISNSVVIDKSGTLDPTGDTSDVYGIR